MALRETTTVQSFMGHTRMNYETPPGGITITGYIVRRLHKTSLLLDIPTLLAHSPAAALAQLGIYAAASGTSWGPANYQPYFDRPGATLSEADPDTGALVTVKQLARKPHIAFEYKVTMPNGDTVRGQEAILGTTFSLQGLGMPAPSSYELQSGDYSAHAAGTIYSELAPSWLRTQVRGYGALELSDNRGNSGSLQLDRKGKIDVIVSGYDVEPLRIRYTLR
jgi:hypothetical protein